MRILVLGGAGFIGASIARYLRRTFPEYEIECLDNLKRRGSELNVSILKSEGILFRHGDIRLLSDLVSNKSVDFVIDCSAEPAVTAGISGSPIYLLDTNLQGAINCLEFCRKHGSRLIFISSSRVYPIRHLNELAFTESDRRFVLEKQQHIQGASGRGVSEQFPLDGSRSLYGATKLSAELLIEEYRELYNLEYIINRCGLIAGPGQFGKTDQGVVSHWVMSHIWKMPLMYFGYGGSGKQVRDVLHIGDLCRLIRVQMEDFSRLSGGTYNVGGAEFSVSLLELTQLCQEITGNSVVIRGISEDRYGDIPIYISDNTKIQSFASWKPEKCINETVVDIFSWCTRNEAFLKGVLL